MVVKKMQLIVCGFTGLEKYLYVCPHNTYFSIKYIFWFPKLNHSACN